MILNRKEFIDSISVPQGIELVLVDDTVKIYCNNKHVRSMAFDVIVVYNDAEIKEFLEGYLWIDKNL
jgi:hypothetical protein